VSEDPFAALRVEYRAALPSGSRGWRTCAGLAHGELPAARLRDLQREVHSIAG
jgi:hypothetical protein